MTTNNIYKKRYNISNEIAFINQLQKTTRLKVKSSCELDSKIGWLKKDSPKGYSLDVRSTVQFEVDTTGEIELINSKLSLKTKNYFLQTENHSFSPNSQKHSCVLKLYSFKSSISPQNNEGYYKQVIPIKHGTHFLYQILDESYLLDNGTKCRGLIKTNIGDNKFGSFITTLNQKSYLVIECAEKISLKNFQDSAWAIIISLGYLLAYLMQNECYYFYYEDSSLSKFASFEYNQLRESIYSIYEPINCNPYGWNNTKDIAESYDKKLERISFEHFSNLCNLIYENIEIKGIVLLILECLNRTLLLMPAGFSIALEGLSEYFYTQNSEKLNPIKDKNLSSKLHLEFNEVLKRYVDKISPESYTIIGNKINDFNKPTNPEKLKSPFKILNLRLTDIDEIVIRHRNDFLHGRMNFDSKNSKHTYEMNVLEISLRLLTLLNSIILKMIGYDGYILNHVKLQENGCGKIINEPPYIKLS
ncbi:MAG TPA: hypothetical protein VG738_23980 [Chitinophagaceae bacterium]|nr:hypothetical protein [Chitinophagaceae bacterium]